MTSGTRGLEGMGTRLQIPGIALNDGYSIPQLGLGTWQIDDVMAPQIVEAAIGRGYRLIDTAATAATSPG